MARRNREPMSQNHHSPKAPSSQARYAYLRSDGTAYIVAGSAIAGLAAYAYQFLGGRTLGTEAFAPVSTLLSIHFLVLIVILLPIEQLIIRRLTLDRSRIGVPANAYWLIGVTTVAAAAFAFFDPTYVSSQWDLAGAVMSSAEAAAAWA